MWLGALDTVQLPTGTHERYFWPKSLYTGTSAAWPIKSYMAVPSPMETSSPIHSKGLLPRYWSITSCGSVRPLSPRPIRPVSVWATYIVRRVTPW